VSWRWIEGSPQRHRVGEKREIAAWVFGSDLNAFIFIDFKRMSSRPRLIDADGDLPLLCVLCASAVNL
jgi:hypothetical protein